MRSLFLFSLILAFSAILSSCSNIKMLTSKDIYSEEFLKKIEQVQILYKQGRKDAAMSQLIAMNDKLLSEAERGKKNNFIGVLHFSSRNYDQAVKSFQMAQSQVRLDRPLQAQLYLNLASVHYKLNENEKAFDYVDAADPSLYTEDEREKYHNLRLVLAKSEKKHRAIVTSLFYLMSKSESFDDVENSEWKSLLVESYRKLSSSERAYLLESEQESGLVVVGYLAAQEALHRYYFGDRSGAQDVLSWLDKYYGSYDDVEEFVSEFEYRIANFSKIDVAAIGVVLPLSGERERFGKKALLGVDTALNRKSQELFSAKLYIKDNANNAVLARKQVSDLVEKNHVSVIIGGLFPSTAKEEYLEARKYGALFISLSPVHLPKEEKNHLLIEISGSVQSQVSKIFSKEFLDKFGRSIAMLYPDDEGGHAYMEEVWRRSEKGEISIASLASYDKQVKDYREWVKKLLGLMYPRERQEELETWKEIYSLEKKQSIRRIQTLRPVIDFDWVFLPSYPHEAIQIIPSFNYFDANSLRYVGGPSWASKKLIGEQSSLGRLNFVGDDVGDLNKDFVKVFVERNVDTPSLVETLAFESMYLALTILTGDRFDKREQLERKLVNSRQLKGISGSWSLDEGIWIKDMDILEIRRGNIQKADLTLEAQKEGES